MGESKVAVAKEKKTKDERKPKFKSSQIFEWQEKLPISAWKKHHLSTLFFMTHLVDLSLDFILSIISITSRGAGGFNASSVQAVLLIAFISLRELIAVLSLRAKNDKNWCSKKVFCCYRSLPSHASIYTESLILGTRNLYRWIQRTPGVELENPGSFFLPDENIDYTINYKIKPTASRDSKNSNVTDLVSSHNSGVNRSRRLSITEDGGMKTEQAGLRCSFVTILWTFLVMASHALAISEAFALLGSTSPRFLRAVDVYKIVDNGRNISFVCSYDVAFMVFLSLTFLTSVFGGYTAIRDFRLYTTKWRCTGFFLRLFQLALTAGFFTVTFLMTGVLFADAYAIPADLAVGSYVDNPFLFDKVDNCPGRQTQEYIKLRCGQEDLQAPGIYNVCTGCLDADSCNNVGADKFEGLSGLICYWNFDEQICQSGSARLCGEWSEVFYQEFNYERFDPECFRCYNRNRCENLSIFYTQYQSYRCGWNEALGICQKYT